MRSEGQANLLVVAGPAALLGGALAFQYLGGIHPCEMCLWQRWPHAAAIGIGLLALAWRSNRAVIAAAALAVLVSGGIAAFHVGVEQHWWQGITACAAAPARGSADDILRDILATPLVRCDAVAWSLFGVSMAGWNAIFSMLIGGGTLWRLTRRP